MKHYKEETIYGRLSYRICKSGNLLGIVLMIASVESISLLSDFTVRFICAPFFYDGAFFTAQIPQCIDRRKGEE